MSCDVCLSCTTGKKDKRCVATRDLWSDANIAGSAGTGQQWLREKKCSLMQTMTRPAVRALKSTLRQLVKSQTATHSTVDVL